jgi:hypothetical protein
MFDKIVSASILTCLAIACPARAADTLTGTMLYKMCTGADYEQSSCLIWISGVVAGMYYSQASAQAKNLTTPTCLPNQPSVVTGDQARLIIEKRMRDYPQVLNNPASAVAGAALELAFPCRAPNR